MAVHFNADGFGDGFAPPLEHAVMLCVNIGIMAAVFVGMPSLITVLPTWCINIPNRNFWAKEENRPQMIRRLRSFCDTFGVGIMCLFLLIQWTVFQANQKIPPKLDMLTFWFTLGIFGIFCIIEIIRLNLSFRLPK
jgi:sterol desaturase/sphingolipid hydroxylase (fatty acid hydroxylase superfamily)